MMYTLNLIPAPMPAWLKIGGAMHESASLSAAQLASLGWLPLLSDTDDAPLGYSLPIQEVRDGVTVAVQYALGTSEERNIETLKQWRSSATCTPLQGEIVLSQEGLRPGWLSLVDSLPEIDQIRYLRAATWRRDDPLMTAAIAILRPDLSTEEQHLYLDTLFIRAAGE